MKVLGIEIRRVRKIPKRTVKPRRNCKSSLWLLIKRKYGFRTLYDLVEFLEIAKAFNELNRLEFSQETVMRKPEYII